jgi:hypothetical protein
MTIMSPENSQLRDWALNASKVAAAGYVCFRRSQEEKNLHQIVSVTEGTHNGIATMRGNDWIKDAWRATTH